MNRIISPSRLQGTVSIPASKSIMHRALICAALANGSSIIRNCYLSQDIFATMDCLEQLGASFQVEDDTILVEGIFSTPSEAVFQCRESGSTIRFLMPIAAALGVDATFFGEGKLVTRPMSLYQQMFSKNGMNFDYSGQLPAHLSGTLQPGVFTLKGNVSSQFISGLLFALPLLHGDSVIEILPPFESKSYVDLTIQVLNHFGIQIEELPDGYRVPGNQQYHPQNYQVEGDYSQGAFFLTAAALGNPVSVCGLSEHSAQGDQFILTLLREMGIPMKFTDQGILLDPPAVLKPFSIHAENIPDLVPILCVLANFCSGISTISQVKRLKIKESDRIASTQALLESLGGHMEYDEQADCITVYPHGDFEGGTVFGYQDHRIVMAAAIGATRSKNPITIEGAECVAKSYPSFFEDYEQLGGICHAVHLE